LCVDVDGLLVQPEKQKVTKRQSLQIVKLGSLWFLVEKVTFVSGRKGHIYFRFNINPKRFMLFYTYL